MYSPESIYFADYHTPILYKRSFLRQEKRNTPKIESARLYLLHAKAQGSFWILGRKLIDGSSLFLPQATQLLEKPVDKMGKIGVEKQDLWLTLRYDPRFRKRSLAVYTALFGENIAADVSTLIYIKHIYQYLSAISCLTFCMSGVRRVTYALATVPYPSAG